MTTCPAGCPDALEPMGRWAPYATCPRCGTGFFDHQLPDVFWGQGAEPSPEQEAEWSARDDQRAFLVGAGPGRLLDVGCGFGHFVRWAVDHGWDAFGTDFDPWARERTVVPGRVRTEPAEFDGSFDVVTLWDVLEHVPRPIEFAAELRERLQPGGRLVVGSPNFAALKLRWALLRRDPARFHDVVRPEEHVVQFTEAGMLLALERAGYGRARVLRPPMARRSGAAGNWLVRRVPQLRRGLFAEAFAE